MPAATPYSLAATEPFGMDNVQEEPIRLVMRGSLAYWMLFHDQVSTSVCRNAGAPAISPGLPNDQAAVCRLLCPCLIEQQEGDPGQISVGVQPSQSSGYSVHMMSGMFS